MADTGWIGASGTLSGDWNTASDWSDGVPQSGDVASFQTGSANPYTISGDGNAGEIIVERDQISLTGSLATSGIMQVGTILPGLDVDGGGQVTLAAGGTLAASGGLEIGTGTSGTLTIDGQLMSDFGVIGAGSPDQAGAGSVVVDGPTANWTTGTALFYQGSLTVENGASVNGGDVEFGFAGAPVSATVSAIGSSLTATSALGIGPGTLTVSDGAALTASNVFVGSVHGGTLAFDDTASVALSGTVMLDDGSLQAVDATGQTGAGRVTIGNAISLVAGVTDTLAGTSDTTLALTGAISGGATVDIDGGTVLLSSAGDSFSGGVTIEAGALDLANGQDAGTGMIAFAGSGSLIAAGTLANAIALAGTDMVGSPGTLVLGGQISDLSPAALAVDGGTIVLSSAANDYSGGSIIDAGTLELAGAGVQGTGTMGFAPYADGTLRIDGTVLPSNVITGFGPGDVLDLAGLHVTSAVYEEEMVNKGTLVLNDGTNSVGTLSLGSYYPDDMFVATPDGHGGTDLSLGSGWEAAQSGAFGTAANWLGSLLPGHGELAFFATGSTTPYTVSGNGSPGAIAVEGDQVTVSGNLTPVGLALPFNGATDALLLEVENGGELTIDAGASLSNAKAYGGIAVGGTGNGTLTIEGMVNTANSDAAVGGAAPSAAGIAIGSAVSGSGTVIVSGSHGRWSLYELDLGNNGFASADGVLVVSNGGQVSDQQGVLGFRAGAVDTASVSGTGSRWTNVASLTVRPGDSVSISNGGSVTFGGSGTLFGGIQIDSGSLSGSGTLTIETGASLSGFGGVGGSVASAGSIEANGGVLRFTGAVDSSGSLAVETASTLDLRGVGNEISGVVTGGGTVLFDTGSSTTLAAGTEVGAAALEMLGSARLSLGGNLALGSAFTDSAGSADSTLELGANTLTLGAAASFTASSGQAVLQGTGTLAIEGQATLSHVTIGGSVMLDNTGTIAESGQVTLGDSGGGTPWVTNAAGGVYAVKGAAGIGVGSGAAAGFSNDGVFEKVAGGSSSTVSADFINVGSVVADSGTLSFLGGFANGGSVITHAGTLFVGTDVTGTGQVTLQDHGVASFGGAVGGGQTIDFGDATGTLKLSEPGDFQAVVAGLVPKDVIDLVNTAVTSLAYNSGTLTVNGSGEPVGALSISGNHAAGSFFFASDGHGGTNIGVH